ncbi:VID27 cytoplasmic protein [Gigaspora rosea]|uniref:VID27 cytoplasmic protein n=1 Tax=Gigaspora rosea TaxID=44941 RepID=A0A397V3T4_9GLOM|nr:VID27 cytoplasmic protein [Gigaspora rosea]
MFMIKSLGKLIWGDPDNPELIQISNGELYLVRPNSPKGNRECIFREAQAIIRRTGTEWQYQLVIDRIFEEGEEELVSEDESEEESQGGEEEKVFLIDESLEFRKGQIEGLTTFAWRDLTGDPDDLFEFVCDVNTTAHTTNAFEYTMYSCMFERKYKKSREEATEQDLQSFIYVTTPVRSILSETSPSTPTRQIASFDFPGAPSEAESIISVPVELHVFDANTGTFLLMSQNATASIMKGKKFEYWHVVSDDNTTVIGQRVEPKMNPVFNRTHICFIWCYFDESDRVSSFLIRFRDLEGEANFKKKFAQAMYETLNEVRAKEEEQEYFMNAYQEDVEMTDAESTDKEDTEEENEMSDDDDDDSDDDIDTKGVEGDSVNTQLIVGYKHDRSFVLKGNKIGVFKHTDDDRIELTTNIGELKKLGGKKFDPSKGMLHEEDSAMILMDPQDEHNLFKMDLEYGKIVEEWNVHDVVPVTSIFASNKFAQTTAEKTLIGMSHNSLYRIDPRLPDLKLVDSQRKQYMTKSDFSCGATDAKGHIVVGSEKGDVKLFDSLGKIAKTNLPALGSAIKGIDVTSDGRWIIATTARYLLLLDTLIKSDPNKRLGFEKSFPKDNKPIPRRLQLKPEHLALMDKPVNFTPARFNTGLDEREKTIVTSTGPFVITWNFRRVKQGKLDEYQIKRYTDDIVADNFKFGQDRSIVVTFPHDVTLTKKTHLSTPTKAVLSPSKYIKKSKSIR